MKKHLWGCVVAAGLVASSAGAVEFFVPVPYFGGGTRLSFGTEFAREDLNKINVDFTYIAQGKSGVGMTPAHYKVLPGPSTDKKHPLLTDNYNRDYRKPPARSDPKYSVAGAGLVIMEGEQGLLGIETAVVVGPETATAWELPMLTADDVFEAGTTAHVLNLMKDATVASHLSLFNLGRSAGRCQTRLIAPNGQLIEQRTGVDVPALGAVRIPDILNRVVGTTTGLSVEVTCDQPFYSLGSFPAPGPDDVRVHYPSHEPPALGTKEIFVANASFNVTGKESDKTFQLPLAANTRYRSILIDFDVKVAPPTNPAYFRGVLGMWRPEAGLRFGKTLYFGVNERYDRGKLMIDLGTPYIEILTKKSGAPMINGKTYHFHIEANSDERLLRQLVTDASGKVVADMRSGLLNDDLITKNGKTVIVGFGLPGIADGAYSPPYGWKFSKIVITGYRE
jgi:hypothetical protein